MKPLHGFIGSVLAASAFMAPASSEPIARQNLVRASLVAEARSVRPARPFWVAVRLQMRDGWHVNWLNPGDAGLAPIIEWELPAGFTAGPIQWPYPEKFVLPELAIFGYGGEVFLLSEITPPRSLSSTQAVLKAHVEWLACAEACIPGEAEVQLSLAVSDAAEETDPAWAPSFERARLSLPDSSSAWGFGATLVDDGIRIQLAPPEKSDVNLKNVEFFPVVPGVIANASPQTLKRRNNLYQLEVERDRMGTEEPLRIQGVLVSSEGWGSGARKAVVIDVPVTNRRGVH